MFKRILSLILAAVLFVSAIPIAGYCEYSLKIECKTRLKKKAPDQVWDFLVEETGNKKIAAGIMGYFQRESNFKSNAIANWHLLDKDACVKFTKALSDLNEKQFIRKIRKAGGYGMGQWYSKYHLKNFYKWFNKNGYEYDDIEGQCKFVVWEMKKDEELWKQLLNTKDVYNIGLLIGAKYDGAGELSRSVIASMADAVYKERVLKK